MNQGIFDCFGRMDVFSGIVFCGKQNTLRKSSYQERKDEVMKHVLKGAAILAGVMVVHIIINVICNMNGVELNSTVMSMLSTVCAILIYNEWIKKEK